MERKRLIGLIAVIQSVLCLIHLLFYETWIFSPAGRDTHGALWIILVLGFLSVSFVAASLLAFRYTNAALRAFYRVAAVWMGLVSFLVLAAVASWIIFGVARLAGLDMNFHRTVELLLGAAVVAGLYGVYNASWTRITRTTVRLANLPAAWHGRRAALISDVHLGHVRNGSFLRRLVAKILREEPDAIFIAGDLYDGTAIDARRAAEPLNELVAPQGVYFVAGNHEQFGTANICMPLRRPESACSRMRRWKRTVCRLLACRTGTQPKSEGLRRRYTAFTWIAIARAFC